MAFCLDPLIWEWSRIVVIMSVVFGVFLVAASSAETIGSGWQSFFPDYWEIRIDKTAAFATAFALTLSGVALILNAWSFHSLELTGAGPSSSYSLSRRSYIKNYFRSQRHSITQKILSTLSLIFDPIMNVCVGIEKVWKKLQHADLKSLISRGSGALQDVSKKFHGLIKKTKLHWGKKPPAPQTPPSPPKPGEGSELSSVISRCRGAFWGIGIFSALSNILMLTGSFYMLEIYDRVVPSQSIPTLIVLSVVAFTLFAVQGLLDFIRSRVLNRMSNYFEEQIGPRVFDITTRVAPASARRSNGLQPIRDLDSIKTFLSGGGPGALMDLPWMPFYLGIIFMFHPLLGVTSVVGAIILVGLTILTELKTKKPIKQISERTAERTELALAGRRNAEVLASLGMKSRLTERYKIAGLKLTDAQTVASDVSGGLGSISKTLRMILQSGMLGVGSLLVIWGEASGGIIIAGSILSGRALAPVDQAIANWKYFMAARQGWRRLTEAFLKLPAEGKRMSLPKPKDNLKVEALAVLEPSGQRTLIRDVNFDLKAGQGLCILGPSGSGKSTLARALVKAWVPAAGRIRLDGAALDQWPSEELGAHLGYLPQDVELFSGTIAENIARLSKDIDPDKVIAAAEAAGAHQLILTFKDGYQTEIGESGAVLSAGQRQRVALARALYNDPFLVVLDEPNANLDADGDRALMGAIAGIKRRGGIVVVISHRPSVLEVFEQVMIMSEGRVVGCGPRDEVLAKHLARPALPPQKLPAVG